MSNGASRRGIDRERKVRDLLSSQDWLAFRAPASLGCADVIAQGCLDELHLGLVVRLRDLAVEDGQAKLRAGR